MREKTVVFENHARCEWLRILKSKYAQLYGKSAKGRKANDVDWLLKKIWCEDEHLAAADMGLPSGWRVVEKWRKGPRGKDEQERKMITYKIYFSPDGRKFRSLRKARAEVATVGEDGEAEDADKDGEAEDADEDGEAEDAGEDGEATLDEDAEAEDAGEDGEATLDEDAEATLDEDAEAEDADEDGEATLDEDAEATLDPDREMSDDDDSDPDRGSAAYVQLALVNTRDSYSKLVLALSEFSPEPSLVAAVANIRDSHSNLVTALNEFCEKHVDLKNFARKDCRFIARRSQSSQSQSQSQSSSQSQSQSSSQISRVQARFRSVPASEDCEHRDACGKRRGKRHRKRYRKRRGADEAVKGFLNAVAKRRRLM